MNVFQFDLPPTATYRRRHCSWIGGLGVSSLGDGFLTITVIGLKSHTYDQDVYGVEEIPSAHFGARAFMLIRASNQPGDAPQDQPYQVTIGRASHCTCKAGKTGPHTPNCKHREAIHQLISAGKLPAKQLQGAY